MTADRAAEYQEQADYCGEQRARAARKSEKSEWLKMAAGWERMAAELRSSESPPAAKAST